MNKKNPHKELARRGQPEVKGRVVLGSFVDVTVER